MKIKIKKSSIISLVIAFSIAFTAFAPIISYADEVDGKDIILDGEKPTVGETPDGEKPTVGETPDGEKPTVGETPDGEKPTVGETPDGEKPTVGETPDGEKPTVEEVPNEMIPSEEEKLEVEEMSLKQNIEDILNLTVSQINKIVYNFWEDENDVKTDEQSEIYEVLTSRDGNISFWSNNKNSKVKNSCLLKETDGSNRPYFDLRFDDTTKTLTFDYVIEGLIGASHKDGKYVIEGEDGEQTAFCYNNHLKSPSNKNKSPYLPAEDFNGQENKNEDAIKSILYAGSEFDGFGYKQQFNLGGKEYEGMIHFATQDAIWIMLGQMNEQERLKLYQTLIDSYDRLIENANTEEEKAKYLKDKEAQINTKAYLEALLEAGRKELKPNDTGKPSLSSGLTDIKFDKIQDGTYETESIALVGYSGVVKLKLPDGVTAYDENGNVIGTGEVEISTQQKFKLKSIDKPDVKDKVSALSYDYIFPKAIQYFKTVFDFGEKDHSSVLPASKQNLLSYTIEQKSGEVVDFDIGVPTDGDPDVNPPIPPNNDNNDSNGHKPKPSPPSDDTVINPPVPPSDDTVINPPIPPSGDTVINPPVPPSSDIVENTSVPSKNDTIVNPPVPPSHDIVVKSPKTGDETQIMLYILIGVIAICGLVYQAKRVKN